LFKHNFLSYNFVFTYGDLDFKCDIDWDLSGRYSRISLDDETVGIADGLRYIVNYLFDLSDEIRNEKQAFTLFCREIRKFEAFYCNSMNKCI
ncbi:hypothetical protein, partial [Pseudoalteromonas sp. SIMBA_162]|uniref:hypothetical protein n=1 Tax=Pseudoalteromonas sp. SIMBA_162 TaxID=3080867 RepID=UPI003978A1DF